MRSNKAYFIFLSGTLAVCLQILFIVPDNGFLFSNAIGDCSGRTTFMYNALYKDTVNADVVFFGSSKTMNDVNDSLLTSRSGKRHLNFGYCRFGRNLDYFFIEEYCRLHHPKKIVLEVREEENGGCHPLTAFLLPVSKITEDAGSFRPEVFTNLYNKWLCNLKFVREKIFGPTLQEPSIVNTDHGFWFGNKITNPEPLIKKRYADSMVYNRAKPLAKKLNRHSAHYFNKLLLLCRKHHAELYFLYLPSYGNVYERPLQLKDYCSFGTTLFPPDSINKNVLNYSDYGHLNKRGADLLSFWLMEHLR